MISKPERLHHGDTVGILTPASPPAKADMIDRTVQALERLGFRPSLGRNARKRNGFLAGNDRERASDLMRMFTDNGVKGIFCVRGGYGSGRLLPLLDFDIVRRNPKVFVGYSDITALHCAFLGKAGLVSFHGPMILSDFAKEAVPSFTLQSFLRVVSNASAAGSVRQGYDGKTITVIRRGVASGRLCGGNLSLLCALVGTPWQPAVNGRVLFFEDLDEPPYRLDRMLTHLLNAGLLQRVAGVAIGINRNCEDPQAKQRAEFRQTMQHVLEERLRPLGVPVVSGLPFGHVPLNATLPLGIRATLDGNKGDLVLEEPAVR